MRQVVAQPLAGHGGRDDEATGFCYVDIQHRDKIWVTQADQFMADLA